MDSAQKQQTDDAPNTFDETMPTFVGLSLVNCVWNHNPWLIGFDGDQPIHVNLIDGTSASTKVTHACNNVLPKLTLTIIQDYAA